MIFKEKYLIGNSTRFLCCRSAYWFSSLVQSVYCLHWNIHMQSFQRSGRGGVQHRCESGMWVRRRLEIGRSPFKFSLLLWQLCCLTDSSTAGVVAGVLMGVFLLIVLITAAAVYFFFCYKKRARRGTENRLRYERILPIWDLKLN